MKKIALSALFLAAFPGMAYADFSGPYVGAEIGASSFKMNPDDLIDDADDLDSIKDDSALAYGAFGGFRWNLSPIVLGVEGKIGKTDNDIDGFGGLVSTGRDYSIAGLAGISLGDRFLLFGTLGKGWLKLEGNGVLAPFDGKVDGPTASLGGEYLVTEMVSVRLTLSGTRFDKATIGDFEYKPTQGKVSLGLAYSF